MPRVEERRVDARRDLDLGAVVHRSEQREHGLRIVLRVERRIEVDVDGRRLRAQVDLGVASRRSTAMTVASLVRALPSEARDTAAW